MRPLALCFLLPLLSSLALATPSKPVRVAIIFDDGPVHGDIEPLLAVLKNEQVHITLGTVGRNALAYPAGTQAAVKDGHEIANHSFSHEHPKPLSDEKLKAQVVDAQKVFTETVGVKPVWYWLPFIENDPRLATYTQEEGLRIYPFRKIVASMDFVPTVSAEEIRKNATTGIEDGTVILFHEWRKESTEQLPAILAELRKQGCVFLTFSELEKALNSGS